MKNRNGVKLKLDFDPRKNVFAFAYYYIRIKKLNKLHDILVVHKLVKNWYDVILFRAGLKKKIIIKMRDGRNIKIESLNDYKLFWKKQHFESYKKINLSIDKDRNLIKFKFNKKQIYINFGSESHLKDSLQLISEVFVDEIYKFLEPRKRVVVNIGASIGDSAIYFALKGAKHVYAFEPYPYSYNIAKWNIKKNKLKNKITLVNAGCGSKDIIHIPTNAENYI